MSSIDLRQTSEYARYLENTGWQVTTLKYKHSPIYIFIKSLGPLGSIIKIQRPSLESLGKGKPRGLHTSNNTNLNASPGVKFSALLPKIQSLAYSLRAIMVKIEPDLPLPVIARTSPLFKSSWGSSNPVRTQYPALTKTFHHYGYSPDSWPLLPTRTVVINLQQSLKTIRSQFKKDARYCLRKAENNNLTIEFRDHQTFFTNWKRQARKKHLWTPSKKNFTSLIDAFGPKAFVLNCFASANRHPELASGSPKVKQENETWLAGVLLLTTKTTAYYYYASSNHLGRQLHAPYLLVWEAIKIAKKKKLNFFDFEGIVDPRFKSTKKWSGFSHFKCAFGRDIVEYPGSYSKYFGPLGHFLKLSQSLFG
jgi:lipid II:glycine glycyltransferase (peptidoglycan interpeptide bridge formation enzyme)